MIEAFLIMSLIGGGEKIERIPLEKCLEIKAAQAYFRATGGRLTATDRVTGKKFVIASMTCKAQEVPVS